MDMFLNIEKLILKEDFLFLHIMNETSKILDLSLPVFKCWYFLNC